ncbi:pyruvate kinase [Prolixibacteraceae bacterium Z1-6]|uniref:Pyruvate kinase n=1 Tax=Draconibacterium aestuarii TaxID=2998507 RepID=A0A9X3FAE6_9BACT|nr:pyruvate kinase [Prolixibacteraceae bacterium Z1-6]
MINYTTKTKIIATIGPASSSKEQLKKLFEAGVNVCRLNFSHGSHEDHLEVINRILELNDELRVHVAILADLQGPKLRIGEVENNGIELTKGATIKFVNTPCVGNLERVYMSYIRFAKDVKIGDTILIDDGKLKLEVTETNHKDCVTAKVIFGGILSSKKGVNLPRTKISLPSLTEKDIKDAEFALENNVDWIALSFVRKAEDILDLRKIVEAKEKHTGIIAKIEKPEALDVIDDIINVSDGIMVARGDLGVELHFSEVPIKQKMIVDKCIKHAKPVIIATQMMESMITNFSPTRAEANDVANAVIDGTSAVMLSGETSVGKFPVEVIQAMSSIVRDAEKYGYKYYRHQEPQIDQESFILDSTCHTASIMAIQSKVNNIVVLTYSGDSVRKIASYRPKANIYGFTPNKHLLRQMSLIWGVQSYPCQDFMFTNDAVEYTLTTLFYQKKIEAGELVVSVGTLPLNKKGSTNMVKFSYYKSDVILRDQEHDQSEFSRE